MGVVLIRMLSLLLIIGGGGLKFSFFVVSIKLLQFLGKRYNSCIRISTQEELAQCMIYMRRMLY